MLHFKFLVFLLSIVMLYHSGYPEDASGHRLAERIPYPIPLVKLSVIDNNTAVRISRPESADYTIISGFNDLSVKNSRSQTEKTTYRESPDKAYYLTDFEARQLLLTTKSFIATLEEFEKNLKNEKWGHCLYLDAFLPKFIRGFYLLLGASRNATEGYLKNIRSFEKEFDVSLNSPRSDARIAAWRKNPEGILKLRIASKELVYQLKMWEKRELSNPNRNPEIALSLKSKESLDLFVRIYFFSQTPVFCSPSARDRH
ncbi:MAG: hypothetical protein JW913_15215 [Chitinispirillaceae bacterium]|nr:hypothetical protein [Chitinispirillaceae bacterium]